MELPWRGSTFSVRDRRIYPRLGRPGLRKSVLAGTRYHRAAPAYDPNGWLLSFRIPMVVALSG